MNTDSGTSWGKARIAELDRIIQTEEAKPNPDYQLIDDCIREIGELEGAKVDFSEEEVAKATGKILRKAEREKKRKRIVRYAAAAAAVFVLVGGVTACTVNPAMMGWLFRIARMQVGTEIGIDNTTYVNNGKTTSYATLQDLLIDKKLSIYYPVELEKYADLVRIKCITENGCDGYGFFYSEPEYSFVVYTSIPQSSRLQDVHEIIGYMCGDFYVDKKDTHFNATGIIEEYYYIIRCPESVDIESIIQSFERKQ